ncbi:hypothetical protein CC86DRAFT_266524, partial [Ophiobolus disseminans]
PPTPMGTDTPPKSARKRTASDISPPTSTPSDSPNSTPQILRRHQHRRRNIAASIWGPDISPTPTLAPPQPFNIYKSLLRHPNLFFPLCLSLPYASIIDLYAIDKEFHYRLNKYSVSILHDYARRYAPMASRVFTWLLYPEVCISDPMLRPMDGREWLARDVPGWAWVGMVLSRQSLVRCILSDLALEGCKTGPGAEEALYKFWVVMELRSTHVRRAFLADGDIWSDADIQSFHLFLLKLDMRFSDPLTSHGYCALSHALLTQRSLKPLATVLSHGNKLTYDTVSAMLVQTYPMHELDTDAFPWLDDDVDTGIPPTQWGMMMKEGWSVDGARMESCVDLVVEEGVRRELHVQGRLLEFVEFGYGGEE